MEEEGSPGGLVVNNLPANAGDNWFDPWSAKIPHAMEQLTGPLQRRQEGGIPEGHPATSSTDLAPVLSVNLQR